MSRFATDFTFIPPTQPAKEAMTDRLSKIDFVAAVAAKLSIADGLPPHESLPLAVALVSEFMDTECIAFGDSAHPWCRDMAHGLALNDVLMEMVRRSSATMANEAAFADAVAQVARWPEIWMDEFVSLPGVLSPQLAAYAQAVADGCGHVCELLDDDDDYLPPPRVYVIGQDGKPTALAAVFVDVEADGTWVDIDGSGKRLPRKHAPGTVFVVYGEPN